MDFEFLFSLLYSGLLVIGLLSAFCYGARRLSDISKRIVRTADPGPGETVGIAFMLVCLGIGITVEVIFLLVKMSKLAEM